MEYTQLQEWQPEALQSIVNKTAEKLGLGMGKVGMPLRVAVCGTGMSPGIDVTLNLIGRERTLQRLQRAIEFIEQKVAQNT